jgi:hypothetical protein
MKIVGVIQAVTLTLLALIKVAPQGLLSLSQFQNIVDATHGKRYKQRSISNLLQPLPHPLR